MKTNLSPRLAGTAVFARAAIAAVLACGTAARAGEPAGTIESRSAGAMRVEMTDQIVVRYAPGAAQRSAAEQGESRAHIERAAGLHGLRAALKRHTGGGSQVWKLERPVPLAQAEAIVRQIAGDSSVAFAHPDLVAQAALVPTDPGWNQMWSYAATNVGIGTPGAWDLALGAGVRVAVIDTGYRPHADLAGRILPGYDMIADLNTANDGNGRDADALDPGDAGGNWNNYCKVNSSWHGTHVAGTVAANINNGQGAMGVAPGAQIVPVRVLGRCGGYSSDTADAIRWAVGSPVFGVPGNPNPARVLNLSLGGTGSCYSELASAVSTARSAGALVVVAAGNDNVDASAQWPANCSGVLAVAATDATGGKASFSNFGAAVGVAAPGVGIYSTSNTGTTGPVADTYLTMSGTSMATPHVSGVAALAFSASPGLNGDELQTLLRLTAKPFPAPCSGCGYGIVDAQAAVAAARTWIGVSPASISIAGKGGLSYLRTLTVSNRGVVAIGPVSTSLARVSGTVEWLYFGTNGCAGATLAPGASCTVELIADAGCGSRSTFSRWDLTVSAGGATRSRIVPVSVSSAAGICY